MAEKVTVEAVQGTDGRWYVSVDDLLKFTKEKVRRRDLNPEHGPYLAIELASALESGRWFGGARTQS